jgi:AcrR family transcriptional regulator
MADIRTERADAAANRRRILDAARSVLACHGLEGASIDAVTAAAGVGKGTVFRRFGDRAGLFQAVMDDSMREFQDAFMHGPPPLGPGAPPRERLIAFFDRLIDIFEGVLDVVLAAERDRNGVPVGGYVVLSVHVASLIEELAPELDAPLTAQLLMNAVNPNLIRYLRRDAGVEPGRIKAAIGGLIAGLGYESGEFAASCVGATASTPSTMQAPKQITPMM